MSKGETPEPSIVAAPKEDAVHQPVPSRGDRIRRTFIPRLYLLITEPITLVAGMAPTAQWSPIMPS